MNESPKTNGYDRLPDKFAQTQWTLIVNPSGNGDPEALERLSRAYWYPLYWFARRKGSGEHDAEDQVQSFFARLLAGRTLKAANKARGKFRTFLLTAFHRFLISAWRKGANDPPIDSLDELIEARGDAQAPSVEDNRDTDFYRDWAITLINLGLQRLQTEKIRQPSAKAFSFSCQSSGPTTPQSPCTCRATAHAISPLVSAALIPDVITSKPSSNLVVSGVVLFSSIFRLLNKVSGPYAPADG